MVSLFLLLKSNKKEKGKKVSRFDIYRLAKNKQNPKEI